MVEKLFFWKGLVYSIRKCVILTFRPSVTYFINKRPKFFFVNDPCFLGFKIMFKVSKHWSLSKIVQKLATIWQVCLLPAWSLISASVAPNLIRIVDMDRKGSCENLHVKCGFEIRKLGPPPWNFSVICSFARMFLWF